MHAVTANGAVAVYPRHYIGSSQLHVLTAFTSRERDPDIQCVGDCVGFYTTVGLVLGSFTSLSNTGAKLEMRRRDALRDIDDNGDSYVDWC